MPPTAEKTSDDSRRLHFLSGAAGAQFDSVIPCGKYRGDHVVSQNDFNKPTESSLPYLCDSRCCRLDGRANKFRGVLPVDRCCAASDSGRNRDAGRRAKQAPERRSMPHAKKCRPPRRMPRRPAVPPRTCSASHKSESLQGKKLKFPNTLPNWADRQRAAETNAPISRPDPSARDSLYQILPQLPLVLHLAALGRPPGFLLPLPGRLGRREEVFREFLVPGSREELRRRLDHLVLEPAWPPGHDLFQVQRGNGRRTVPVRLRGWVTGPTARRSGTQSRKPGRIRRSRWPFRSMTPTHYSPTAGRTRGRSGRFRKA